MRSLEVVVVFEPQPSLVERACGMALPALEHVAAAAAERARDPEHRFLWRPQVEWIAMQEDEAVVCDFVMEPHETHKLSDETFHRAKRILGERQVVDLTVVGGTYVENSGSEPSKAEPRRFGL